jgi:glycerol-3-phosphate dehydrogenase (NAD(P)+)
MKICVLGAGAWGTALAVNAGARHGVTLWARDAAQADHMKAARENARYLAGASFPAGLSVQAGEAAQAYAGADLVIIATPMAALRGQLHLLRDLPAPVAWLSKGVEPVVDAAQPFGLLAHEIRAQVAPRLMAGVLSGPSFAQEVAQGRPTALVAASAHAQVRDLLVEAFHGPALRVYGNDDIVGVEVGGAVKNVRAIATGLCDGLSLGLNARAALITRGLAEISRLAAAAGGRRETPSGLSGLGDLVLTCTGSLSRNRHVGIELARGRHLNEILASMKMIAEGVNTTSAALALGARHGVELPIATQMAAVLEGRSDVRTAVEALMLRPQRHEAETMG